MITLLFLDDYHVGDPLFLADLGRRLSKLGPKARILIVHRAGEAVTRALEGADTDSRATITERTIRETNQGIARRLTEEGVPAVSIQGSDRGLFRLSSQQAAVDNKQEPAISNQASEIRPLSGTRHPASGTFLMAPGTRHLAHLSRLSTNAGWLLAMIGTGSIPVISPLMLGDTGVEPADPVACAAAIAGAVRTKIASEGLEGSWERSLQAVLFCSTRKGGLFWDGHRQDSVPVSDLDKFAGTIDTEVAAGLIGCVDRLVATNSAGLFLESGIEGTNITGQMSD